MNYNYIFDNKKINEDCLTKYGFIFDGEKYLFKKRLSDNNLQVNVRIMGKDFDVKVYDLSMGEEYFSINLKNATGYVAQMQNEVKDIIEDIVEKCFSDDSMRAKVLDYVKRKYGTIPECPWDEGFENYGTLKADNGKWYGLIMPIKYSLIGNESDRIVDVINIKLPPEKIVSLIDKIHFYPAYHMNKKYWITILLDNLIDEKKLYELIDESYSLIGGNVNRSKREWIIPANPKYFDVISAFENSKNGIVNWKQGAGIEVGDVIYMYVARPYSAILYKGEVTKVHIPHESKNKYVKVPEIMQIKVLDRYDKNKYTLELMKKYGVTTVRGPRYMSKELEEIISKGE